MPTDYPPARDWIVPGSDPAPAASRPVVERPPAALIANVLGTNVLISTTLFAAAMLIGLSAAWGGDLPQTLEKIKPAVVGVGTMRYSRRPAGEFHGTGFAVADGQHVITNAHVLPDRIDAEEEEFLAVFVGQGDRVRARRARVKSTDSEHDLALLWVEGRPLPVVELADRGPEPEGSDLAFTGFPLGTILGMYPATHRGTLASVTPIVIAGTDREEIDPRKMRRLRSSYLVYHLDANAYPGNSGSPVFRPDTGEVVGVVNKIFVQGRNRQPSSQPGGITYAIPVEHVHRMLEAADLADGSQQ